MTNTPLDTKRPPNNNSGRPGQRRGNLIVHAVLMGGVLVTIVPFAWELTTSLKTFGESTQTPPTFLPHHWTIANYKEVFTTIPFLRMFGNSVFMTAGRTIGQLVFCTLGGYAFARLKFRGRTAMFSVFIALFMVPSQFYLLPHFEIMKWLGLLNTPWALTLSGLSSSFGLFWMRQAFSHIPRELEDAARIDGAGPGRIFFRIMLPLVRPAQLALALQVILWSWTDLLWPIVANSDPHEQPLSAGLAGFQEQYGTNFPVLMAGALLASLPLIILFVIFQRRFIQSVASTGVAG